MFETVQWPLLPDIKIHRRNHRQGTNAIKTLIKTARDQEAKDYSDSLISKDHRHHENWLYGLDSNNYLSAGWNSQTFNTISVARISYHERISFYYKKANQKIWSLSALLQVYLLVLLSLSHALHVTCSTIDDNERSAIYVQNDIYTESVFMPDVTPTQDDDYLCTSTKLNVRDSYIIGFEPHADMKKVHHMLVFGCSSLGTSSNHWQCGHHHLLCHGMSIIYAWGRNADPLKLPDGVGFKVGRQADVNHILLQVHYLHKLPEKTYDRSGVTMRLTRSPQPYLAGIQLIASGKGLIPKHTGRSIIDITCQVDRNINVFAYRVHAHSLGRVIVGYRYNPNTAEWTVLSRGNPQWPQAFYPTSEIYTITPDDYLAARCVYNSTFRDIDTTIGGTSMDEMCNLYLMYYVDNTLGSSYATTASGNGLAYGKCVTKSEESPLRPPRGSDAELPPNPALDMTPSSDITAGGQAESEKAAKEQQSRDIRLSFSYTLDEGYPIGQRTFGQIAAVDIDKNNNVIIFHRHDHVWGGETFDYNGKYLLSQSTPISLVTVITIDPIGKKILNSWGKNLFFMPHGLSIDLTGNYVWLTDVALHQVFKFPINGTEPNAPVGTQPTALITLGKRFEPGWDENHFCQPTSVADTGDFVFVADGYCNGRVLKFTSNGRYVSQFGQSLDAAYLSTANKNQPIFSIPHKITYARDQNLLCVADRENGAIKCFQLDLQAPDDAIGKGTKHKFTVTNEAFNGRLFSIDYSSVSGGILVAVSGPSLSGSTNDKPVSGFVFNITSGQLISKFAPPTTKTFGMAHDIAISESDGDTIYVVEVTPSNLWKFSRPKALLHTDGGSTSSADSASTDLTSLARAKLDMALTALKNRGNFGSKSLTVLFVVMLLLLLFVAYVARDKRLLLYKNKNNYDATSLFNASSLLGARSKQNRCERYRSNSNARLGAIFSRRGFYNLFNHTKRSDFYRIPLEDSDVDNNSDNDKSDSDVEEFNISQATSGQMKIEV